MNNKARGAPIGPLSPTSDADYCWKNVAGTDNGRMAIVHKRN